MTLYDLYLSYEKTAHDLWAYIKEIEIKIESGSNEPLLQAKVTTARSMYRDVRRTAQLLKNYYQKWDPTTPKIPQKSTRRSRNSHMVQYRKYNRRAVTKTGVSPDESGIV